MKFIFILFCVLLSSFALAIPNYEDRYVNDFENILLTDDIYTLNQIYSIIEENTTAQVVFVSVNDTEGYDISQYAVMIGEDWGVGQSEKDNGVVILYVAQTGKIWVSVGYGVEGILPDSKIGRLLDENYVPYRDNGELSEGIVQFSFAIAEEMLLNANELTSGRKQNNSWIVFLIIALIIFVIIFSIANSRNRTYRRGRNVFVPSNFGGSGNSFGGGSFGGGGAGR